MDTHVEPTMKVDERETVVLHYMAQGMSNKEISARLHYNEDYLEQHIIRNLYAKMEINHIVQNKRTRAVALAYENGIIGNGH